MHTPEKHRPVLRAGGVRHDLSQAMPLWESDPERYYDRVMPAWRLLMGNNLHYGYFESPHEDLDAATHNLTLRVANHARLDAGLDVLDVGCGDGQTSCFLAEHFGCRVIGISTGKKGVDKARRLSRARGLSRRVAFRLRDGMDNGFPDGSFDRVWVIQSSHFMLDKRRLLDECVRVLRPGGRLALGDIMLRAPLPMIEVVRHREEFLLLHRVFGRAKMESLQVYQSLAEESGLRVDVLEDVTAETFPTFDRWRRNAVACRDEVSKLVGETLWREFLVACDVLERFWTQGWFGYGVLAGERKVNL
jgi:cyclopropane fatty-acyl-phospholipid synthase-like methyltransferase